MLCIKAYAYELNIPITKYKTTTGTRQANRVRGKYLHSILRQDVSYFDKDTTTGKLLLGLNEDTNAFSNAISEKVGTFLQNIFGALVGIGIGKRYSFVF